MKKILTSLLVICMLWTISIPASAAAKTDVDEFGNRIVPSESLVSGNVADEEIELVETTGIVSPRMDIGEKVCTMEVKNLEHGEMVVTDHQYAPKTIFKSDFPHGTGEIVSRFTSDDPFHQVKVGICRVSSNGTYVPDVAVYLDANGSDSSYFATSSMDPDKTYYGFINNDVATCAIDGTATIYALA